MSERLTLVSAKPVSIGTGQCLFCGRDEHEADLWVTGVSGKICAGCVDLCAEIVATKRAALRDAPR